MHRRQASPKQRGLNIGGLKCPFSNFKLKILTLKQQRVGEDKMFFWISYLCSGLRRYDLRVG